jgi:6-phosphofructokinase 1
MERLEASSVANIIQRGGTLLKTARCPDFHKKSARKEAANILRRNLIDALVVIGGDGSFAGAHLLEKETGFPCIGVPGTIDNDIPGTEDTIGFDTAVNTALEAIDRIRDTASSHDRIFLVEVMGRSSGHIGLMTAIGGGAETVIIPEAKESIQSICATIERGIRRGKTSSIIVVSEGDTPGLAQRVGAQLKERGYGAKVCILGHTQRGGSPTAHDRLLGSTLGAASVAYVLAGRSNCMVGIQKGEVTAVPFTQVFRKKRPIEKDLLEIARIIST